MIKDFEVGNNLIADLYINEVGLKTLGEDRVQSQSCPPMLPSVCRSDNMLQHLSMTMKKTMHIFDAISINFFERPVMDS